MQYENRTAILRGEPDINVTLRRSRQARRLNLRVSGLDGRVTLTIPKNLPLAEAFEFLRQKESWLRNAKERVQPSDSVMIGAEILLRGRRLRIMSSAAQRGILPSGDSLLVPPDPNGRRTGPMLASYFKHCAQHDLLAACDAYSAKLGRRFTKISLRDTRSRWGSCSSEGRLMFSWRLIMAPPEVLRYVAAHEVAHLAHMDHSPAFWACVERLMPTYQARRDWLRHNGAQLHSYCFKARPASENG